MAWMAADGQTAALKGASDRFYAPAFSPDGKRLAYTIRNTRAADIWVYDLGRETPSQLTFNVARLPYELRWTNDGNHIVYAADQSLWWIRSDGTGQPYKLLDSSTAARPGGFTPDGKTLVYTAGTDIYSVTLDHTDPDRPKAGTPEVVVQTPAVEVDPALSADGKWLAYASNESGREDVYVRPFPPSSGSGGKYRISTEGGKFPLWSHNGHELFFLAANDRIMVASYTVRGTAFEPDKPRTWSDHPLTRTAVIRNLELHPDGKRFIVFPRTAETEVVEGNLQVTMIFNFFEELKRKVP